MGPKGRVAPAKADETAAARIELSSADKDKDRIKNHSVKLLKYFRPILYHLRAIGKFPFSTSQLVSLGRNLISNIQYDIRCDTNLIF